MILENRKIGVGCLKLGPREKHYLQQVIDSNRLSYGPMTREFERRFAELHGCKYAVFCNSGTSALHMALAVLKEKCGWLDHTEVLVPAITFIATSNIVLHNRMWPVFVDVDPKTYTIDPFLMEKKITEHTKAIIPVHVGGLPCDMRNIMKVADQYGLRVIEDSCEAMFARVDGEEVGSFGDIGCFSTYVAHLIVTGVGGLATTNDADLMDRLRSYMNHGRDTTYLSIDDDDDPNKLKNIIPKRFSFVRQGHSFRATELEAAIGLGQLEQVGMILNKRKKVADYYNNMLDRLQEVLQLPTIPEGHTHSYMFYPIVMKKEPKQNIVQFLEQKGIETRDLLPITNQPYYQRLFGKDILSGYPNAEMINECGFYIGCHQELSLDDVHYVVRCFYEYFKRVSPV